MPKLELPLLELVLPLPLVLMLVLAVSLVRLLVPKLALPLLVLPLPLVPGWLTDGTAAGRDKPISRPSSAPSKEMKQFDGLISAKSSGRQIACGRWVRCLLAHVCSIHRGSVIEVPCLGWLQGAHGSEALLWSLWYQRES